MKTTTKKTVNAAAESKTAAVSTTAKAPAKTEAKPVVEKKPVAKAAKPAAEKKAAKPAAKTEKKPAAKKTTAAKPAAKKTAAKKTAAASKAPAKKSVKKTVVTIDSICTKVEKKISKSKAAAIKEKIAVDIEVWGFEDGSKKMYIEISEGKATVSPHTYDAKDFRVSLSFANAVAFADGKITLKALLDSNDFYAEGNVAKAVKLASVF